MAMKSCPLWNRVSAKRASTSVTPRGLPDAEKTLWPPMPIWRTSPVDLRAYDAGIAPEGGAAVSLLVTVATGERSSKRDLVERECRPRPPAGPPVAFAARRHSQPPVARGGT